MERKHLSTDEDGVENWVCRDGKHMWFETVEVVTHIVDRNRELQANFSRTSGLGDQVIVAELPETYYWDLQARGIVEDRTKFRKVLDDKDFADFRTNTLRLSR